jgi:hypothetical protein
MAGIDLAIEKLAIESWVIASWQEQLGSSYLCPRWPRLWPVRPRLELGNSQIVNKIANLPKIDPDQTTAQARGTRGPGHGPFGQLIQAV